MAKPVLPVGGQSLEPAEGMQEGAGAAPAQEIEEGEAEDETYLVPRPPPQGSANSSQVSTLLRA